VVICVPVFQGALPLEEYKTKLPSSYKDKCTGEVFFPDVEIPGYVCL
jgi:hypothetical protein